MIIDSHYAGPGYRPVAGWYRRSLSNVRRIVGADDPPHVRQAPSIPAGDRPVAGARVMAVDDHPRVLRREIGERQVLREIPAEP
ncbi:hypothetical protein CF640_37365 [Burkholderia pseudomallei]|nr:hypothetical protein [Burkholderia pseudomallei]PNW89157.1 hypothetical protein CF640_37365 [Burkholderia pseudomallei]